ncbi:MAG: hypothetical protein KF812_10555 [Fimbriimonadaceae bacterium]|nr:hypothetical protein [Fimbriimonadaceae bacterium]
MPDLKTSPTAQFNLIRENLGDRYKSGFPIIKELIQNAEDADANDIFFHALPGWVNARNPLFRVPGLLVVNNGKFDAQDGEGIMSLGDSHKTGRVTDIGRFGFGQKALFHLCDAFVVHALGYETAFSMVVNPCFGLPNSNAREWDPLHDEDLSLLEGSAGSLERALLIWVPFRRDDLLPAPKLSFTEARPTAERLLPELLKQEPELRLILASLRKLTSIEIADQTRTLLSLHRLGLGSNSMLGPDQLGEGAEAEFQGSIHTNSGSACRYVGREVQPLVDDLTELQKGEKWPRDPVISGEGLKYLPRKAASHAAVILVTWDSGERDCGRHEVTIDWGVFLPIEPAATLEGTTRTIKILLHGYFFVDAGRQYVLAAGDGEGSSSVAVEWNEALRDKVLLPLLPTVLHDALKADVVSPADLSTLVTAIRQSEFGRRHIASLTSRVMLVRLFDSRADIDHSGWQLVSVRTNLRPLPVLGPVSAVELDGLVVGGLTNWAAERGLKLAPGLSTSLALEGAEWTHKELDELLSSLAADVFINDARARALAAMLEVALGDQQLSKPGADALLAAFRTAIADARNLASDEAMRGIWRFLPACSAVPLPHAASRVYVLQALATADDVEACLRDEWLPESAKVRRLSVAAGIRLLEALQPLLDQDVREDRTALGARSDVAGSAALAIAGLVLVHEPGAVSNPRFAELRCFRADDGSGKPVAVSLQEVTAASREGRLFKSDPRTERLFGLLSKAAPGSGALIVRGAAAALLDELAGEPFKATEPTLQAFASLATRAAHFGPASDRERLLSEVYAEGGGLEATRALRVLATGDQQAASLGRALVALPERTAQLDQLALRLLAGSGDAILVSREIASNLSPQQRNFLRITELDTEQFGRMLVDNASALEAPSLDEATVRDLLCSNLANEHLRSIPILRNQHGQLCRPLDLWRETLRWPIPAGMAGVVHRWLPTEPSEASTRAEQLVGEWSPSSQLEVAAGQPDPHLYALPILEALQHMGSMELPENVRRGRWIRDVHDNCWCPKEVLELPPEVEQAVQEALGTDHGAFALASTVLPEVRNHAGFAKLHEKGLLPGVAGAEDAVLRVATNRRLVGFLGAAGSLTTILPALARRGISANLPGWPLLSALLRLKDGRPPSVLIQAFASVDNHEPILACNYLSAMAAEWENGAAEARDAYKLAFEAVSRWPVAVRRHVFGSVLVPTASGAFRNGSEVAAHGQGIADSHLLSVDLRQLLQPQTSNGPVQTHETTSKANVLTPSPAELASLESDVIRGLRGVLQYAEPFVPHGLLLVLVGLFGRSDAFENLVRTELRQASQADISRVWTELEERVESQFAPNGTAGSERRRQQRLVVVTALAENLASVNVETLAGSMATVPTRDDIRPLGVIGGFRVRGSAQSEVITGRRIYSLQVATPAGGTPDESGLKALCLEVSRIVYGEPTQQTAFTDALASLLADHAIPDQVDVQSVLDEVNDHLDNTIRQLKPPNVGLVSDALNLFDSDIYRVAPRERYLARRRAKFTLWNKLNTPNGHAALLNAVRNALTELGYDSKRVFFELFQNADDAYAQQPVAGEARFKIVQSEESPDQLRIVHWGRPINHLGEDPKVGERMGWGRDLSNMLTLNLSNKREGVTGRFGLGFKGVHLFCKEVGVASRFVACRIRGGMLPEIWASGRRVSSAHKVGGRSATIIELVEDPKCEEQVNSAITGFRASAPWLPAMTRHIRRIELGHERVLTWTAHFDQTRKPGVRLVTLGGSSVRKALALELSDQVRLFLCLDGVGPVPAEVGVPRLWSLAPLEEELRVGWLMNNWSFRVDPGRGRLAGTLEQKHELFRDTGRALGAALVDLYELVTTGWAEFAESAGLIDTQGSRGSDHFLMKLFDLFSADLKDPVARRLHDTDRGLGYLLSSRRSLPSGLPGPFAPLVELGAVRHLVSGAMAEAGFLATLEGWKSIGGLLSTSIGSATAETLADLGFSKPPALRLRELLKLEVGKGSRIDQELAGRLGTIVAKQWFEQFDRNEQTEVRELLRKDAQFRMEDGTWGRVALPPRASVPTDKLESTLLQFAPKSVVAAPGYVGMGLDFYQLASEQGGFQRDARTIARWAAECSNPSAQRAAIQYLVKWTSGDEMADELARLKPAWIPASPESMKQSPLVEGMDERSRDILLSRLYPRESQRRWAVAFVLEDEFEEETHALQSADTYALDARLEDLYSWWNRNRQDKASRYFDDVYPTRFDWQRLQAMDEKFDRETWFTFFALGIFRTIGRTRDSAHRNFIDRATERGWWQEMASARLPEAPEPWISRLEAFASGDATYIDYPQWHRAVVDLYAAARWLPEYAEAFRLLPVVAKTGPFSLSDAWRLSASPIWQRRGLEGGPLTQSLGLGANWMIREAARNGLWRPGEAALLHPYAWSATRRVRDFLGLEEAGLNTQGGNQMDLSRVVYDKVRKSLGNRADFQGDLDLPLQLHVQQ